MFAKQQPGLLILWSPLTVLKFLWNPSMLTTDQEWTGLNQSCPLSLLHISSPPKKNEWANSIKSRGGGRKDVLELDIKHDCQTTLKHLKKNQVKFRCLILLKAIWENPERVKISVFAKYLTVIILLFNGYVCQVSDVTWNLYFILNKNKSLIIYSSSRKS